MPTSFLKFDLSLGKESLILEVSRQSEIGSSISASSLCGLMRCGSSTLPLRNLVLACRNAGF